MKTFSYVKTDSAIMGIRRSIERNRTNYRRADEKLKEALKDLHKDTVMREMTYREIEWYYMSPGIWHMDFI